MSTGRGQIRTPEGIVTYDIIRCDGKQADGTRCATISTRDTLMGWYELSPIGTSIATLGSRKPTGDEQFCSIPCMITRLNPGE
jgi:hypothetical protein